jgi:CheY-like chemotaxis protein
MPARRVLIVDDSRVSRMLIRSALAARHPDWVYEEAGNVDEAVAKVTAAPFDVVSLDYNMPGANGLDGVASLRAIQPNLIITMFTANVQQAVRDRASSLGVGFVDKPVNDASIVRWLSTLER